MSGQNTHKQITAMVILMFLGVASLGAYVWFDDGRRVEAEDQFLIEASERGARLFANNCRVCHGNSGEGLIGPALNTAGNTLAFRAENSGALGEIQARYRATIECGRNGSAMPPWAVAEGGSLNFFHIDNLVSLITTNSGNAWEEAHELAVEQDELALQGLETALADAEARATAQGIADAVNAAVEAAGGDSDAALVEAVIQITRGELADLIEAEFGEELDAADAAGDADAVATIEAEISEWEAELLAAAVDEALDATDGDALRALTRAHAEIADLAVADAEETLDLASANVEAGRPIQQVSTPIELTGGTCGQR